MAVTPKIVNWLKRSICGVGAALFTIRRLKKTGAPDAVTY